MVAHPNSTVIVQVSGGVAEVIFAPEGIEVSIIDLDNNPDATCPHCGKSIGDNHYCPFCGKWAVMEEE